MVTKEELINGLKYISLYMFIFGIIALFLVSDETRIVSKTVPYNVIESESYQEPYQQAIYKETDKIVTKYKIVYYGSVSNEGGFWHHDTTYSFDNAISIDKVLTNDNINYNIIITNLDGTTKYYTGIDYFDIKQKQVPYSDNVKEEIIDRYETKYKTLYKNVVKQKTRIEYSNVTKSRVLWYIN